MNPPPATTIRNYLEAHGGQAEVPFHHLLTTWGLREAGFDTRMALERELGEAGIAVRPGLQQVRPDTLVLLQLARAESRRAGAGAVVALACAVLALAVGGGVGAYLLAKGSGDDLEAARAQGLRSGEREAARRQDPGALRKARTQGRRQGYRSTYQGAFDSGKGKVLAAAPKSCGDARKNETPTLAKVRAQGVSCPTALDFVRGCENVEAGCQGYSCSTVSIAWESSEYTCTSGGRTIRWISAV